MGVDAILLLSVGTFAVVCATVSVGIETTSGIADTDGVGTETVGVTGTVVVLTYGVISG